MNYEVDIDAIKAKKICANCVSETYLKTIVNGKGRRRKCSYCLNTEKTIKLDFLADLTDEVFANFLYKTNDQYEFPQDERDGEPVSYRIQEVVGIEEDAANDVRIILEDKHYSWSSAEIQEEQEFDEDSHYEYVDIDGREWNNSWQQDFVFPIKNQTRFFNKNVINHLRNLFDDIHDLVTKDSRKIVREIGPRTEIKSLFRARLFTNSSSLEAALKNPDKQLGPPPHKLASVGRMNAKGISVFYGASDANVAISEVRPIVGSRVSIAKFSIIRQLKILDLTALDQIHISGSYFDPEFKDRLSKWKFLSELSYILSQPVMPGDEDLDYLITQAISDFLAVEKNIDGILFPSIQAGEGWNIALFHHASFVEDMDEDKHAKRSVQFAFDEEIIVWENLLPKAKEDKIDYDIFFPKTVSVPRDISLRLVKDSISILQVNRVAYETSTIPLTWYPDKEITDD